MNADSLYAAYRPPIYTILGVRLKPLSLGHLIHLRFLDSPVVTGASSIQFEDLAAAVLVCSMDFDEACEFLESDDLESVCRDWMHKVVGKSGIRRFLPIPSKLIDIPEKYALFREYLKDGTDTPAYDFEQKGTFEIRVADEQFLKCFLVSRTNMTETEILNRPYKRSVWDMLTLRAMDGQIRFYEPEEIKKVSELKSMANALQERIRKGCSGNGQKT